MCDDLCSVPVLFASSSLTLFPWCASLYVVGYELGLCGPLLMIFATPSFHRRVKYPRRKHELYYWLIVRPASWSISAGIPSIPGAFLLLKSAVASASSTSVNSPSCLSLICDVIMSVKSLWIGVAVVSSGTRVCTFLITSLNVFLSYRPVMFATLSLTVFMWMLRCQSWSTSSKGRPEFVIFILTVKFLFNYNEQLILCIHL